MVLNFVRTVEQFSPMRQSRSRQKQLRLTCSRKQAPETASADNAAQQADS